MCPKRSTTPFYLFAILLGAIFFATQTTADTPANCTYGDIQGYWIFRESPRIGDSTTSCAQFPGNGSFPANSSTSYLTIKLAYPNVATDRLGNVGTWTLIYNQGFEVILNYRRYFAFSLFKKEGKMVTSYCAATSPGWSHDTLGRNWACFQGQKVTSWPEEDQEEDLFSEPGLGEGKTHLVKPNLFESVDLKALLGESSVGELNQMKTPPTWSAKFYPELHEKSTEELIRMTGGRASRIANRPSPAPSTETIRAKVRQLPDTFDWTDRKGVNYVSPVRQQGTCGSCYAFASMAALEARIRIATNNSLTPIFSTQHIVDCSPYSQGCEGGFPYLIAGKYAQDFGVIADSCYPYVGKKGTCQSVPQTAECQARTYTVAYSYIGGYYGACNEDLMRLELVQGGPFPVNLEMYPDLLKYTSGVYNHHGGQQLYSATEDGEGFNPFEVTNHVVLVVGYGVDAQTGKKYWKVKNSWGSKWGMKGFFLIERGVDECGIESLAVAVTPIPN